MEILDWVIFSPAKYFFQSFGHIESPCIICGVLPGYKTDCRRKVRGTSISFHRGEIYVG